MAESIESLQNHQNKNPDLWDQSIKNKFFNLINTRKLEAPPNVPIIMEADCRDINLERLKSKTKILNYAIKMNFNDFDYYFRTEEEPYNTAAPTFGSELQYPFCFPQFIQLSQLAPPLGVSKPASCHQVATAAAHQ